MPILALPEVTAYSLYLNDTQQCVCDSPKVDCVLPGVAYLAAHSL